VEVVADRPHWPAWVGAGVTVVGLSVGIYYAAVSKEAKAEADHLQDQGSADRDRRDARNARIYSAIAFGAAAVSALGAVVYYYW
jgi:hypothetical protein